MAAAGVGLFCCLCDLMEREPSEGELETVLDGWITTLASTRIMRLTVRYTRPCMPSSITLSRDGRIDIDEGCSSLP